MRLNPYLTGLLPGFIFLFSACVKTSQIPNTPPDSTVGPAAIYIAGQGNGNGVLIAKYWTDSAQVILSDSTHPENINGIYASGKDVYLAGAEWSPLGIPTATSWKNGVKTLVNEQSSAASGITVSGGDTYISGYIVDYSNANIHPLYWKNGVAVPLSSDSSTRVYTSAIAVSGNDVYVAGYETNPASPNREIARYWKNGIAVNLSDTSKTAEANAIFILGGDVYVAGYETAQGANPIAKYWKNGVSVSLSDGSTGANLTGICVSGTNVFACGTVNTAGNIHPIAVYWKNGTLISLKGPNTTSSQTSGITVFGKDVYVSGNDGSYPKLWINATPVNILSSSPGDLATGIFVGPK